MSLKRGLEDDFSELAPKAAKHEDERVNKKHTLDSDEEDSDEERKQHYEILDDDDIEGQEEGQVGNDGEVKITPFNMKEELEEGHFDTEGNFHWDKSSLIKDNWLDNIDWMQIKDTSKGQQKNEDLEASMDSDAASPFDQNAVYKQILEYMEPGETIAKALRRLGGNKSLSASERLKRKKAGLSWETSGDPNKVTELTEFANKILTSTGNMNIYQETFEHIKDLVESKPGPSSKCDDPLDMYSDDFDAKEKERMENKKTDHEFKQPQSVNQSSSTSNPTSGVMEGGKILMWEYKLERDSNAIQGPHTTEQMQKYVDEGFFKTEVWIRKVGQEGPFYSSKRIDFELYL